MQIGLSSLAAASRVYFPDVDTYRGLEIIAKQGFTHLEYSDQTQPSYLDTPEAELEKIRAHAAGLGLTLWSAHSPCGATNLSDPDADGRAESIEVHKRCLDGLAVLGVPNFVIHQVGGGDHEREEQFRLGLDSVFRIRRYARQYGIRLLIENFPFFDPQDLLDFLEVTGPDGMGIVLDTGHEQQMGRDPAEGIRTTGDFLVSLHIHDNQGAGKDDHLPPTYGTTDWKAVMYALAEVSYGGPFMMEVIPHVPPLTEMSPEEVVRVSYETMVKVIRESEK